MEKWEYKTLKFQTKGFFGGKLDEKELENALNELGREGWELVSCFDTAMHEGSSRDVVAILKRRGN